MRVMSNLITKKLYLIILPMSASSGLTWDDCHDYLHKLGYDVKVELVEV